MHFFDEKTSEILEKLTKDLDTKDSIRRFEEMEDTSVLTVQNIGNIWIGEDSCRLYNIASTVIENEKEIQYPELIVMRDEIGRWYPIKFGKNLSNTENVKSCVTENEDTGKITGFITDVTLHSIFWCSIWLSLVAKEQKLFKGGEKAWEKRISN